MQVELGPVDADDVQSWVKFSRRVIAELHVDRGDLHGVVDGDALRRWSRLIDEWSDSARGPGCFRWSRTFDNEVGEYLLYCMERVYLSDSVRARVTTAESTEQQPFTTHVLRAFVDALEAEGRGHGHFADQIRAEVPGVFDQS